MRGDYSTFGPTIRELRKERDLTLRDIQERTGLDFTYISKIEHGHSVPPSEEKITALAAVLTTNADELIFRAGKIPADLHTHLLTDVSMQVLLRKRCDMKIREEWS